jgi:hypothetical protein
LTARDELKHLAECLSEAEAEHVLALVREHTRLLPPDDDEDSPARPAVRRVQ